MIVLLTLIFLIVFSKLFFVTIPSSLQRKSAVPTSRKLYEVMKIPETKIDEYKNYKTKSIRDIIWLCLYNMLLTTFTRIITNNHNSHMYTQVRWRWKIEKYEEKKNLVFSKYTVYVRGGVQLPYLVVRPPSICGVWGAPARSWWWGWWRLCRRTLQTHNKINNNQQKLPLGMEAAERGSRGTTKANTFFRVLLQLHQLFKKPENSEYMYEYVYA